MTAEDLEKLYEMLEKLLLFNEELRPFLPLLAKAAALMDNPASRFLDLARHRQKG